MLLVFLLLHIVTIVLLFTRWLWRMWFFPIAFLFLIVVWLRNRQQKVQEDIRVRVIQSFQDFGLIGAWTIFLLATWQLATIFWLIAESTALRFLAFHLVCYILAIVMQKRDMVLMMHRWWRMSALFFVWQWYSYGWYNLAIDVFAWWIALSMALYAFIVFIISAVGVPVPKVIHAYLFLFLQLTILLYVMYRLSDFSVRTIVGWQIYLSLLYIWLERLRFSQHHAPSDTMVWEDALTLILRGDRVRNTTITPRIAVWQHFSTSIYDALHPLLQKLPHWVFTAVWGLNIISMLLQLSLVLFGSVVRWVQLAFWSSIVLYAMNYFILQRQHITVVFQRALLFSLINFAIYLTIYRIFWWIPLYLVWCGVVRSVLQAVMMINARNYPWLFSLTEQDYWYRLTGNMLAIIANSYFIFLLPVSLQLRFTIVMLYFAIQALLLRYQLSTVKKNMHTF